VCLQDFQSAGVIAGLHVAGDRAGDAVDVEFGLNAFGILKDALHDGGAAHPQLKVLRFDTGVETEQIVQVSRANDVMRRVDLGDEGGGDLVFVLRIQR
jgi:hypothetical protein